MPNKLLMHLKTDKNKIKGALFLALLLTLFTHPSPHVTITRKKTNNFLQITLHFIIQTKDCLYKDFLDFSVDHPSVTLSTWKTNVEPVVHYEPLFKNNKEIFNTSCTIQLTATQQEPLATPVNLYCTYYQKSEKKIKQLVTPLKFTQQPSQQDTAPATKDMLLNTPAPPPDLSWPLREIQTDYVTPLINIIRLHITDMLQEQRAPFYISIIIILIFLCLLSFCFFMYKYHPDIFGEYKTVSISLCISIAIGCMLIYISASIKPLLYHLLRIIFLISTGFYFTQKSMMLASNTMRRLCTLIGCVALVIMVFLCFKTYQEIDLLYRMI